MTTARRAIAIIAAALTALGAGWGAAERPTPTELRRMITEILASGYQLEEPLTVRIERWLTELLMRLLQAIGSLAESGPLAGMAPWVWWVLFGICLVLLVLIIVHIAVTVRGLLVEPLRRARREPRRRQREDPASVLRSAEQALGRGEYERAIRLLYRATLLRLDRLGLLSHDPARTNWENLHALQASDRSVREAMEELTGTLDRVIYAGEPATERTWRTCRGRVDVLWRAEGAGG